MAELDKICIVGGGPAGAFLALLLARAGKRVTLLEAQNKLRRKICGEYLCPRGVELLSDAKLLPGLMGASRPVRGMRIVSPAGIAVNTNFPSGEGLAVRRDVLDNYLLDTAERAGVELRRGARVLAVDPDSNGFTLRFEGGSAYGGILIGADGRQSFVAKQMGVEGVSSSRRLALHAYFRSAKATNPYGEMHILPGGEYIGLCPVGEHEWNFSLICDADELRESRPQALLVNALNRSPELRARFLPLDSELEILSTYPITHAVRAVAGENWALVGDSAGFLDPLTGEGIYQALSSSTLLAAALLREKSAAHALSRYSHEHAHFFSAKRRINQSFQKLIHYPRLCNLLARYLRKDKTRGDVFIGIIGNVIPVRQGLRSLFFSS